MPANVKSPPEKKTKRVLVFEALARRPGGVTANDLKSKLGMSPSHGQMGVILRGEIAAGRIRCREEERPDSSTQNVYYATPTGLKHLKERKINSFAKEKGLVAVGRGEAEL